MSIYLIHFDKPFGHARHYMGYIRPDMPVEERLKKHREGRGARLMKHVTNAGIGWRLVRIWETGDRHRERSLKNQGGHSRKCPICRGWITNKQAEP